MTRPHTTLPLDEAALDDIYRTPFALDGHTIQLVAQQARAALALEAERDALKAQVERLREAINSASHELRLYGDPGPFAKRILDAALAASPAQSLAAHDAEVRKAERAKFAAVLDAADAMRESLGCAIPDLDDLRLCQEREQLLRRRLRRSGRGAQGGAMSKAPRESCPKCGDRIQAYWSEANGCWRFSCYCGYSWFRQWAEKDSKR